MKTIRRILINALLITGFACLVIAIVAPLAAEATYGTAKRLVTQFLWNDAEIAFQEAMKADPYNSQYPVEYGDFLQRQSQYKSHKAPYLTKAQKLYEIALNLNPRNAEYWLKMGEVSAKSGQPSKAMEYFRKALLNDLKGFNTSYSIGYAGIYIWDSLDKADREFILDRLRYTLRANPWYAEYICPALLQKTKDVKLLERIMPAFRHDRKAILDNVKKSMTKEVGSIVLKSDWHGMSDSGKNLYEEGNMYWNGTIDAPIRVPAGNSVIRIHAKGSPANNIYPYMLVELDGINIDQVFIDSSEWKDYDFKAKTDGGVKVLSITFLNDGGNDKEDRNLYVGEARVAKDER